MSVESLSNAKINHAEEDVPRASRGRAVKIIYSVAALASLIGLADAIYLTVEHLSGRSVQCTVIAGCSKVLASSYATVGDLPLAALGAFAYFTTFSLATLSAFGYTRTRTLLAVVVTLMFATTLWLVYLQAFVIRAFCEFCLLSAATTTTLMILVILARRAKSSWISFAQP